MLGLRHLLFKWEEFGLDEWCPVHASRCWDHRNRDDKADTAEAYRSNYVGRKITLPLTCQEYMNILAISIIDVSSSGNSCSGPLPQTSWAILRFGLTMSISWISPNSLPVPAYPVAQPYQQRTGYDYSKVASESVYDGEGYTDEYELKEILTAQKPDFDLKRDGYCSLLGSYEGSRRSPRRSIWRQVSILADEIWWSTAELGYQTPFYRNT